MGLRETSVLVLVCGSVERDLDQIPYTHVLSHPGMYSGILVGLLQAPVRPECDHDIILLVQADETTWICLKTVEAWISI